MPDRPASSPLVHRGPWGLVRDRIVYDNPWIRVVEHDVIRPDGAPGIYGVVSFKNLAVGVLPLHADGSITLVGQYRFALDAYSWECPEGGGALDVDPLETAKRELKEETGLVAGAWRELVRLDTSNSVTDERAVCFLALDLEQGEAEPEPDEVLAIQRLPFAVVYDQVCCGAIRDGLTVAMILRAACLAMSGGLPEPLARAMLTKENA